MNQKAHVLIKQFNADKYAFSADAAFESAHLGHSLFKHHKSRITSGNGARFKQEALRLQRLRDLHYALFGKATIRPVVVKKYRGMREFQFVILAIAGTMFAICDGFDGVTSILCLFGVLPRWLVFIIGFAFSLLSVALFYGFSFVDISTSLYIKPLKSRQLLDVFIAQLEVIDAIRAQIETLIYEKRIKPSSLIAPLDGGKDLVLPDIARRDKGYSKQCDELQDLFVVLQTMIRLNKALANERLHYLDKKNQMHIKLVTLLVTALAGVLFFSYGFFSGQSLALTILNALFTSVSAAVWPVMVTGIIVGLASFSIFWFVEPPEIERLVSRWFGIDQDKLERLPLLEQVTAQEDAMGVLQTDMQERCALLSSW